MSAEEQVRVWRELAGRWRSGHQGDDEIAEIAEIYQARATGRTVTL